MSATARTDGQPSDATACRLDERGAEGPVDDPAATLRGLEEWALKCRREFPILACSPELAYLDSAATAQKPHSVLEAVQRQLTTENANAGRGSYPWASRTTAAVETARCRVAAFLGDPDAAASSVHLVGGASAGLWAVTLDWLTEWLADGDEIVVPHRDHQANLIPWYEAAELLARRGVRIEVRPMPYDAGGDYDDRALRHLVTERTRFLAATHVHHVYGADMDVHLIREAVGPDVVICLDTAQSVGHLPVDVGALDVDFVVFSGHKAMALPGCGVVWSRDERGPVFRLGGWAGSPNTTGVASLVAALDWLEVAGVARIDRWTTALATLVTDRLASMGGFEILGCQENLTLDARIQRRHGIVTFRHQTIPANDIGFVLAQRGLMVRADAHCQGGAGPDDASVRVSLHVYNTVQEIERLLAALEPMAVRR